jgi:transposase
LLPPVKVPGPREGWRPRISDEAVFYRLVLFLRAGCSWEVFDLLTAGTPVSGSTVRRRLRAWRAAGVFEAVCEKLMTALPAPLVGYLDATFIRSRGGGDQEVGLTRHGKGSKLQVMVNDRSVPVVFLLVSANPAEATTTQELLDLAGIRLPLTVVADRAYDSDTLRDEASSRGSVLVVPHRRGPPECRDFRRGGRQTG